MATNGELSNQGRLTDFDSERSQASWPTWFISQTLAWKIHTEINQGGEHRVHGAPTLRKEEATRCWQQFMRVDAI